jgi:hypothetical protein
VTQIILLKTQYNNILEQLHIDLKIFCNRLGIMYDEVPTLVTGINTMVDILVNDLPYERRLGARDIILRNLKLLDGKCCARARHKIVFVRVNPRHLRPYAEYYDTLAHELTHYRFFGVRHDIRFYELVEQLKNGKTFPKTRLYLDPLPDSEEDNNIIPGTHEWTHTKVSLGIGFGTTTTACLDKNNNNT